MYIDNKTESFNEENREENDVENFENNKFVDQSEENNKEENSNSINNEKKNEEFFEENICLNEEILKNKCKANISNEKMTEIYNYLKNELINNEYEEKTEIYTNNTVYQISTIKEQKDNNNLNISSIDFGECEKKLKKYYKIPEDKELIVLKLDIKYEGSTYVQYEVYHPTDKIKLNLTVCENIKILIYSPINLDEKIISLYNSLDKSGYNLFDLNDSFFSDICTPYTSVNGTDIILTDRKNSIYNQFANLSFCQTGCKFQSFNYTTQRVKCNCITDIENIKTMINDLSFAKNEIIDNFYAPIKNSNFKVLKCYHLLYDIDDLIHNIGCIIMSIIYLLLFILLILFCFTYSKNIDYFIDIILINVKKKRIIKINKSKKRKGVESSNLIKKSNQKSNLKIKTNNTKEKITSINSKKNLIIKRKKFKKSNNFPPIKRKKNKLSKSSKFNIYISKSKISTKKLNENTNIFNINNIIILTMIRLLKV